MEEHLILRLPDELKNRLDKLLLKASDTEVYYEKEHGRNYIFVIGKMLSF